MSILLRIIMKKTGGDYFGHWDIPTQITNKCFDTMYIRRIFNYETLNGRKLSEAVVILDYGVMACREIEARLVMTSGEFSDITKYNDTMNTVLDFKSNIIILRDDLLQHDPEYKILVMYNPDSVEFHPYFPD